MRIRSTSGFVTFKESWNWVLEKAAGLMFIRPNHAGKANKRQGLDTSHGQGTCTMIFTERKMEYVVHAQTVCTSLPGHLPALWEGPGYEARKMQAKLYISAFRKGKSS